MFDDVDVSYGIPSSLSSSFVGPPKPLAVVPLVIGVLAVVSALVLPGLGLVTYALGLASVAGGLVYRFVARSRQMDPMYLPNLNVDRLMLFGVLVGFAGVVMGALHLSQRVVT